MIYYCLICEQYLDYIISTREYFDHAFGVDYLYRHQCPYCQSEQLEKTKYSDIQEVEKMRRTTRKEAFVKTVTNEHIDIICPHCKKIIELVRTEGVRKEWCPYCDNPYQFKYYKEDFFKDE